MSSPLFKNDDSANVYNMPSGVPFLRLLASGLQDALGERLSDALILLPTRRAVRELGEAFIQIAPDGARAALLPMMRPLADVDPEEPPFEPGDLAHEIIPAINSTQRRFALSQLVLGRETALRDVAPDPAGALALTEPLLSLLDDSFMEELDTDQLSKLDPIAELSAKHYENSAVFYKIVSQYWPDYLKAGNVMDPMQRRVALLRALAAQWEERPPAHPVIIAGSTGTLAATANLMRVVARQKDGLIVLPGLDQNIDDAAVWDQIEDEHPQSSLKRLLETIGIDRKDVQFWPFRDEHDGALAAARRRLISEALVPATATADWLSRVDNIRARDHSADPVLQGLEGLSLIEARTHDEEAAVIALAMRQTLETTGKTAALVTPDPALGRRVRAKLSRWDVHVDVSAGQPLEETPAGAYLTLILELAADPWNPVCLAAVFKHPLTHLGLKPNEARRNWERLEHAGFRGVRPESVDALRAKRGMKRGGFEPEVELLGRLHEAIKPLTDIFDLKLPVKALATTHCQVAEQIAQGLEQNGAERLWQGEDGDAAAAMLRDLLQYGDMLGDVDGTAFRRLVSSLMRGRVVRPRFGTHPRLQILGPLEARMLNADLIILGGLNEGVWPAAPSVDPLLSYAMRKDIGLSSPEHRFGLAAHDFAQLAAHPSVLLTRCEKNDDGPAVASRWIWRLKTLIRGALKSEGDKDGKEALKDALAPPHEYLKWARALDHIPADQVAPAQRPEPRPPLNMRWPKGRQLSVTRIETWVRDPYALYARLILGLEKLDPLDQPLGPREFGTAIHDALEQFTLRYKKDVPDNAADWLTQQLETSLIAAGYPPSALASQRVRLARMANWLVAWEQPRRAVGTVPKGIEVSGKVELPAPEGTFTLTAKADRIDGGLDGYQIIDYKTGQPPRPAQVKAGFSPQLPLEGVILEVAGFKTESGTLAVPPGPPQDYLYIRLQGRKVEGEVRSLLTKEMNAQDYAADAYEGLSQLIALFDNPETPYLSQPRAKYTNPYGDYDHLARRVEWAALGDDGEGST